MSMSTSMSMFDTLLLAESDTIAWDPQDDPISLVERGIVPLQRANLVRNDIYAFAMDDPRSQPFAMLRSRVLRHIGTTQAQLIAVTSAKPREGKSFVALNLAAALSHIHPTWLIDADLRNPSIARRLGFTPLHGIDTFLHGDDAIVPLRCRLDTDLLTVVAIHEAQVESAKLLASPRAGKAFATLRTLAAGAVCVIDTPPVLEGDDLMILAQHVDAVLLVVEEGRTLHADLRESLRILSPTPVLGTVLNRTLLPVRAQYYGQYPYRSVP